MIEVGIKTDGNVSFNMIDNDNLLTFAYNVMNANGEILYVRPLTMIYVDT